MGKTVRSSNGNQPFGLCVGKGLANMSQQEAWMVVKRLFSVIDKQKRGYIDL